MTASERDLAERAANGDVAAVEELLGRHLPALQAFVRLRCGALLRGQESASDLVQSACRDILENRERFKFPSDSAFKAWLYATAARKVADRVEYWRAAQRDPGRIERPASRSSAGGASIAAIYQSVCSPSQVAMGREAMERIERAFEKLGEEHREVILLARIAGLSHAEIGEQLGIAAGTARMRLFRALGELSEVLKAEGLA